MVYSNDIFDFLNETVKPIIAENISAVPLLIKQTEQCYGKPSAH